MVQVLPILGGKILKVKPHQFLLAHHPQATQGCDIDPASERLPTRLLLLQSLVELLAPL
jgi:hypothetical protein